MVKCFKGRYYWMVTFTLIKSVVSKWRRFLLKIGVFYLINGGQFDENLRHFDTADLIQAKVTMLYYLSLRHLTVKRNEAAASKQPQYHHFYEGRIFMFLASGEAA